MQQRCRHGRPHDFRKAQKALQDVHVRSMEIGSCHAPSAAPRVGPTRNRAWATLGRCPAPSASPRVGPTRNPAWAALGRCPAPSAASRAGPTRNQARERSQLSQLPAGSRPAQRGRQRRHDHRKVGGSHGQCPQLAELAAPGPHSGAESLAADEHCSSWAETDEHRNKRTRCFIISFLPCTAKHFTIFQPAKLTAALTVQVSHTLPRRPLKLGVTMRTLYRNQREPATPGTRLESCAGHQAVFQPASQPYTALVTTRALHYESGAKSRPAACAIGVSRHRRYVQSGSSL